MYTFLLVTNIVVALSMVGVILLQHGQGADMGTSFGRGSQGSLIGVTGSANILSRATSILATIFFTTALAMSVVPQDVVNNKILQDLDTTVPEEESLGGEVPTQQQPSKGDS